jgi:peptide deformylase
VHEKTVTGFEAICLQHEIDHLNGVRNIDRVSRLKREQLLAKSRKRELAEARGAAPQTRTSGAM